MKEHWKCLFLWLNVGFAFLRGKFSGPFRKIKASFHIRDCYEMVSMQSLFFFAAKFLFIEKRRAHEGKKALISNLTITVA